MPGEQYVWDKVIDGKTKLVPGFGCSGSTLAPAALPVQRQSRAKRPLCSSAPCRLTPGAGAISPA